MLANAATRRHCDRQTTNDERDPRCVSRRRVSGRFTITATEYSGRTVDLHTAGCAAADLTKMAFYAALRTPRPPGSSQQVHRSGSPLMYGARDDWRHHHPACSQLRDAHILLADRIRRLPQLQFGVVACIAKGFARWEPFRDRPKYFRIVHWFCCHFRNVRIP
jgi:hypothetical protein